VQPTSLPYRDSNSDPSVVQPVASRYTDYAIVFYDTHFMINTSLKFRHADLDNFRTSYLFTYIRLNSHHFTIFVSDALSRRYPIPFISQHSDTTVYTLILF
jgi:hypothetical protein